MNRYLLNVFAMGFCLTVSVFQLVNNNVGFFTLNILCALINLPYVIQYFKGEQNENKSNNQ